jgi:hypothetical protein
MAVLGGVWDYLFPNCSQVFLLQSSLDDGRFFSLKEPDGLFQRDQKGCTGGEGRTRTRITAVKVRSLTGTLRNQRNTDALDGVPRTAGNKLMCPRCVPGILALRAPNQPCVREPLPLTSSGGPATYSQPRARLSSRLPRSRLEAAVPCLRKASKVYPFADLRRISPRN